MGMDRFCLLLERIWLLLHSVPAVRFSLLNFELPAVRFLPLTGLPDAVRSFGEAAAGVEAEIRPELLL